MRCLRCSLCVLLRAVMLNLCHLCCAGVLQGVWYVCLCLAETRHLCPEGHAGTCFF